jgi:predicted ribonuclease YlaK
VKGIVDLNNYHSVFHPLEDVFELAGPDVFARLPPSQEGKKNLVVLSHQNRINIAKGSHGGKAALSDLVKRGSISPDTPEEGSILYDYGGNVQVLINRNGIQGVMNQDNIGRDINLRVLTMDDSERIEYESRGMKVERPEFLLAHKSIVNDGIIDGNPELWNELGSNDGIIPIERAQDALNENAKIPRELYLNQVIRFREPSQKNQYAIVTTNFEKDHEGRIVDWDSDVNVKMLQQNAYSKKISLGGHTRGDGKILGVGPQDMEQFIACQYGILNPDVEVVFIAGGAGSGKTILSYALGVAQTLHYSEDFSRMVFPESNGGRRSFYNNLVVLKPNDPLGGREVGFLPGNLFDKIGPTLLPYDHAHRKSSLDDVLSFEEMFYHPKRANKYGPQRERSAIDDDMSLNPNAPAVELLFSGFLRGASFDQTFVIIDEAQNFTPYEMKSLLTRMDTGSKYVIAGDPHQFDNPKCSEDFNGFTYAIKHLLPEPQSFLAKLPTSYRSKTARDAASMRAYPQ